MPSLYTCIYKFYKFGHPMPVPGRFAGCHRTSGAGSGPVRRRYAECRVADCRRYAVGRRMPGHRLPPVPITFGCRTAGCCRYRSPSDAGPPIAIGPVPNALCHRSGFGLSKPLHVARQPPLLVQVTLNSLCSTHRHKNNNFCSTLYIVGALFDLSMWDTS